MSSTEVSELSSALPAEPFTAIHSCRLEWESVVADEIRRIDASSQPTVLGPGWVGSRLALSKETIVAFADQCLPAPGGVAIPSISKGAEAVGRTITQRLKEHVGPWRLHVYSVWPMEEEVQRRGRRGIVPSGRPTWEKEGRAGPRRIALLKDHIGQYLKQKQRRLIRTINPDESAVFGDNEWLVQLGMVTATIGYLSVCTPEERNRLAASLSRFPGGIVSAAAQSSEFPSMASRKLTEALLRTGWSIGPGSSCVDLGASPGGWTAVALQGGAFVTAVDRSPLAPDLMQHPALTFVRGDAFGFVPERKMDWLLCDVIAFPERSFELLKRWTEQRWCRQFVVTIKFRGSDDYPMIDKIKSFLRKTCDQYMLRRLSSNKNEVTAAGRLRNS